jgi:hypothetical protein
MEKLCGCFYSCEKGDDTRCKENDYKINVLAERCEDIILKEVLEYAEMFTEADKKPISPDTPDSSKKLYNNLQKSIWES